jgi:hypothetical protein
MNIPVKILNLASLFIVWLWLSACSKYVSENSKPVAVEILPIFSMELGFAAGKDDDFIQTFLKYAKSNNLESVKLADIPSPIGSYNIYSYQINTYQKTSIQNDPAFFISNSHDRYTITFVAYPSDTPFVIQHIYPLVQVLMTSAHRKEVSFTCDDKVLDCERLKVLTK